MTGDSYKYWKCIYIMVIIEMINYFEQICINGRELNQLTSSVKADMKSYIPLETAAICFLANFFPKQGISSEYVTVDFICMGELGVQGAKTENYKMKNSCQ